MQLGPLVNLPDENDTAVTRCIADGSYCGYERRLVVSRATCDEPGRRCDEPARDGDECDALSQGKPARSA